MKMFGWTNPVDGARRPDPRKQKHKDPVLLGVGCGLVEGTQVATQEGWQPIETIEAGDEILTFDGGLQEVQAVVRGELWEGSDDCPVEAWPFLVPPGTIGNRDALTVMPRQGILVESDEIMDEWGDPFAVIPGAALEVLGGIKRVKPKGAEEVYLPVFETDQMVFVNHGALMFCQAHWGVSAGLPPKFGAAQNYNMLPLVVAARLLQRGYMGDNFDYNVA